MHIDSARTWQFDVPPERVWAALAATDDYRAWWPWLRRFDSGGLLEGQVWTCTVKPPLPYSLTFTIALDSVVDGASIEATIGGDLRGNATLGVGPHAGGSALHLRSQLAPSRSAVATFARFVRPLARWGHDWVLETGVRQFATRAIGATVTG